MQLSQGVLLRFRSEFCAYKVMRILSHRLILAFEGEQNSNYGLQHCNETRLYSISIDKQAKSLNHASILTKNQSSLPDPQATLAGNQANDTEFQSNFTDLQATLTEFQETFTDPQANLAGSWANDTKFQANLADFQATKTDFQQEVDPRSP